MEANTGHRLYASTREEWRAWLLGHFASEKEVWLVSPKLISQKTRILYNDAVEEALCFGWIDSINKSLDAGHSMQRFSPRRSGSNWSQANIERLRWLNEHKLIHPVILPAVQKQLSCEYDFPPDILDAIGSNEKAWQHYQAFPAGYRRIRVAYIDGARSRPEEFKKRLNNFIAKTSENKMLPGYGGIDKYYL